MESQEPMNVPLFRKRVFAEVIKFSRRVDSGLSQWALNATTSVLVRERPREVGHSEEGSVCRWS